MFKDEAAILQAAATLAAADRMAAATTAAILGEDPINGPAKMLAGADMTAVERLILALRQMEKEGLISEGLLPPSRRSEP